MKQSVSPVPYLCNSQCKGGIQFHFAEQAPLQANIDKQARKLEEIRAQPHAPGPQGKAAKQKKIDKLDKTIKMQMAKDLGGVRMKQTFLVGCAQAEGQIMHGCS